MAAEAGKELAQETKPRETAAGLVVNSAGSIIKCQPMSHKYTVSNAAAEAGKASAQENKRRELAAGLAVYAAKARLAAAAGPGHRSAPLTEDAASGEGCVQL